MGKKYMPVFAAPRLFPRLPCIAALLLLSGLPSPSSALAEPPLGLWTGDGGSGIRVTVSEPAGAGLSPQDESLLPLIQSTIIGTFQRFSGMTVFDRQNLENILREQRLALDAHFSDDDFIRIGQLTNARLVVFGSVHQIAGSYMLELAVTDVQTGERRASHPPRPVSLLALRDLSAIREASADLLGQLGVNLTAGGLQELRRVEDAARIQAENELARGIAAQRQGMMAEALAYYFRAAAFNPALAEAVSRVSVVSAGISTGNLGQDIRNRMHEYDSWRAILDAAQSFYSDHLPYEFEYNVIPRNHGIDFARRTADLSIEISLSPTDAWNTINDLREGFRIASLNEWNHIPLHVRQIVAPRQIGITMQILNENGAVLSTASYTFLRPSETERLSRELFFRNVSADDITAQFIIRVESVNGISPERAGETGLMQITSTNQPWRIDTDRRDEEAEAMQRAIRIARETRRQAREENARRNAIGASLFHVTEGGGSVSGTGFGLGGHFSPAAHVTVGLDGRFGWFSSPSRDNRGYNDYNGDNGNGARNRSDNDAGNGNDNGYNGNGNGNVRAESFHFSFAPVLGTGLSLGRRGWVFANAFLEMGIFGDLHGLIGNWATPGVEAGLEFGPFGNFGQLQNDNNIFSIRYRHTWFRGSSTHGISIGWGLLFQGRDR